ncbi:MAG TPA: uracil-DNA glycosylase family protein [Methylocystis sp.]|nr:uracil-DNA glycosylase family protein [Methylocystis sp.]
MNDDARNDDETRKLIALLDYYRVLGVDCALDAAPHDRYAEARIEVAASAPSPLPRREQARERAPAPPLAPQEAERAAQALAAGAATLDELREALASFDGGGAIARARHFLFSAGAPRDLMVLDYAPGETEESGGAPFSGAEARLLSAMLAAIGRDFESAYCAYFCPWRPPGGQKLTPHASAALAPFARRHIELAKPRTLLLLGETARGVLPQNGTSANPYAQRLNLRFGGVEVAAVAAPGLPTMLKSPTLKAHAWRALRLAAELLG